jgi:hypothetical protein
MEKYTVTSNNHDFSQFSFSSYDDHIDDWKPGIEINGSRHPMKHHTHSDLITVIMNEPNIQDRPWYDSQTQMLKRYYESGIKSLALDCGLDELHISIEPNYYGSVMLALTISNKQRDQLGLLVSTINEHIRDYLCADYGEFIEAHWHLNDNSCDHAPAHDNADDHVAWQKQITETAGYTWSDEDEQEAREEYEENQQQEPA